MMGKVQPICVVCRQPMRKDELVQVDKLFDQFTHFFCCPMANGEIKHVGTFNDVVTEQKRYKKMFVVE